MKKLIDHLDSKVVATYPASVSSWANAYFTHLVQYGFPEDVSSQSAGLDVENYHEIRLELIATGSLIVSDREIIAGLDEMWIHRYEINTHKNDMSKLWQSIYASAVEIYYRHRKYVVNRELAWGIED